jgi:hypothetical protein
VHENNASKWLTRSRHTCPAADKFMCKVPLSMYQQQHIQHPAGPRMREGTTTRPQTVSEEISKSNCKSSGNLLQGDVRARTSDDLRHCDRAVSQPHAKNRGLRLRQSPRNLKMMTLVVASRRVPTSGMSKSHSIPSCTKQFNTRQKPSAGYLFTMQRMFSGESSLSTSGHRRKKRHGSNSYVRIAQRLLEAT